MIAIIGHVSRAARVAELQRQLDGSVVFLDDSTLGAAANHHRARQAAADAGEPLLAIEDDAILSPTFGPQVKSWIARYPDRLMSFYLGTGHPPAWQEVIAERMPKADALRLDYIELEQLIHAVCYYLPNPAAIVPHINQADTAADYSLGSAWAQVTGLPVIYPTISPVDHDDTQSVDKDPAVLAIMDARHAWRFA
jgi:hypothetical protein